MQPVVYIARNILEAKEYIRNYRIDLISVDDTIPQDCLLENLQKLKIHKPYIKTLLITSNDHSKIMKCLSSGLDDYIVKENLCEDELNCRINKLLEYYKYPILTIINYKSIYLNSYMKQMYVCNKIVYLTKRECFLLECMINNNGFASHQDLISYIGTQGNKRYSIRSLAMIISRLKTKIFIHTGYTLLKSRYSTGYYLNI